MRYSHLLALAIAFGGTGVAAIPDASAQSARAVREQAEASMVLTGMIEIGTEGQVEAFRMDRRDRVGDTIARFVETEVQAWRFEPVVIEGHAVQAQTPVSIRLGGKQNPDNSLQVTLLAANFAKYDPDATDAVTRLRLNPPSYPEDVARAGGHGDVLLLVQVGRDGKVMDVVAEQVNLRVVAREPQMRLMRDKFARVSVAAARKWTFRVPTTGEQQNEASWTLRVPVRFATRDERESYGSWEAFIPGPRQPAPWRADTPVADDAAADLLPSGGVFMADVNKGPRLLTPLGG